MDKYKTSELSRMLASWLEITVGRWSHVTNSYGTELQIDHHALAKVIDMFYEELP